MFHTERAYATLPPAAWEANKPNRTVNVTITRMDGDGLMAATTQHKPHSANSWFSPEARGVKPGGKLGDKGYYHATTVGEVDDIIRGGWDEGTKRVLKMAEVLIDPAPVVKRRKPRYADIGDEVDIDRYYSRDYDHMWRKMEKKYRRSSNKVIDIGFMWGGNCNASREELIVTGAAAVALCNKLESLGYSVGIRAFFPGIPWGESPHGFSDVIWNEVVMKRAGDPLDVDSLTALACHPAVFRYYGVNLMAQAHFRVGLDMGVHLGTRDGTQAQALGDDLTARKLIDKVDIYLPSVQNQAAAQKAINEILETMSQAEDEFEAEDK